MNVSRPTQVERNIEALAFVRSCVRNEDYIRNPVSDNIILPERS